MPLDRQERVILFKTTRKKKTKGKTLAENKAVPREEN